MIDPERSVIMCGTTARLIRYTPRTFTLITRSNSSGSADAGDTCVVEENVDPAEAPDNALGERNGLCLVGHVDLLGNRIRAADSDLLHGLDGCIEVDVGGDHAGALLRETAGAGLADPGARTGDQADLVLESVAHLWP